MTIARAAIRALPLPARRRLRRYECGFCDANLTWGNCHAIHEKCPDVIRLKRAAECLEASRSARVREAAASLREALEKSP